MSAHAEYNLDGDYIRSPSTTSGARSHAEDPAVLDLRGPQSIVDLVYRGLVRLHGEDGAMVELWDPEPIGETAHRVNLHVTFSTLMTARYKDPLPENPTSVIRNRKSIEAGGTLLGVCGFKVDGWGLYSADGNRVRHESRSFILRDISKVQVVVGSGDRYSAWSTSRSATARRIV
jgi:hypothetical protein